MPRASAPPGGAAAGETCARPRSRRPCSAPPPPSGDAEHAAVRRYVGAGTGEIVERLFGDADDVVGDELRSFASAILGVLEAAFPLQHRPAGIVVLGELGEDSFEVHLAVTQRTKPSGPIDPRLEPAVHALPAAGARDTDKAMPARRRPSHAR